MVRRNRAEVVRGACSVAFNPSRLLTFQRRVIGRTEACSCQTRRKLPAIIRPEYKMIPIFALYQPFASWCDVTNN
jgi:hypothetical protein